MSATDRRCLAVAALIDWLSRQIGLFGVNKGQLFPPPDPPASCTAFDQLIHKRSLIWRPHNHSKAFLLSCNIWFSSKNIPCRPIAALLEESSMVMMVVTDDRMELSFVVPPELCLTIVPRQKPKTTSNLTKSYSR